MIDQTVLAQNLNNSRKKVLTNFEQIYLDKEAVKLVARLFYNPDCISLVNLDNFTDDLISLKDFSSSILTAAPTTLANYANKIGKLMLKRDDIITCFATDHIDAVLDNKIDQIYSPVYALSHTLLSGKISRIFEINHQKFAEIVTGSATYEVAVKVNQSIYKKVLIPSDLKVEKGDSVWHHFGIVIDKYEVGDHSIFDQQLSLANFSLLNLSSSDRIIDFSDKKIFHRDILGKIIKNQKDLKRKTKTVSDLAIAKIQLPTNSKIKFIH